MNFAIIAAGEGSRLAQEGVELPKPLVEIAGRPMIGRLLEIFSQAGGRRIVVCVNEFMKEVKDYLDSFRFESRSDGIRWQVVPPDAQSCQAAGDNVCTRARSYRSPAPEQTDSRRISSRNNPHPPSHTHGSRPEAPT